MFKDGGIIENKTIVEDPYLRIPCKTVDKKYNPKYGDKRICECGHVYYRHFDSYEYMYPCGCKYCGCYEFKEKILNEENHE